MAALCGWGCSQWYTFVTSFHHFNNSPIASPAFRLKIDLRIRDIQHVPTWLPASRHVGVGGSRPMVGKKKDTDTAVNFVNPLTVGDTDGDSDGSVDEGQTSFRECATCRLLEARDTD
jgi:hypothetical protein